MTTTASPGGAAVDTSALDKAHPVWAEHFSGDERQEMLVEDSLTWRHVVLLLVSVVSTGVLMMVLTVLWVSWVM